jgi:hypothetical protein
MNSRCLDLALSCHATYDVDENDLKVILSDTENVAAVIECAIVIRDRCPTSQDNASSLTKALQRRFILTSHRMESVLRSFLISNSDGINKAILRLWTGYESGKFLNIYNLPY